MSEVAVNPDALAKALHDRYCGHTGDCAALYKYREDVAALMASAAVVDLSAVADDEALLVAVAERLAETGDQDAVGLTFPQFRAGLRALASVLSEPK